MSHGDPRALRRFRRLVGRLPGEGAEQPARCNESNDGGGSDRTGHDGAPTVQLAAAQRSHVTRIEPGRFALLGFPEPPVDADWALLEQAPAQLVRERDETTLLVSQNALEALLARHPGARVERDLVWIRFEAAMGWEVVGFLARVSGELARAGVPIGTVCGFSRDHLFIAERHLPTTCSVLGRMFPGRVPPRD